MTEKKIYWSDVQPLEDPHLIDEYEEFVGFRFPEDFRACALENNGGMPSLKEDGPSVGVMADCGEGLDFCCLLNFNKREDFEDNTIWWSLEEIDYPSRIAERYVHFAEDSFGNFYCFDKRDSSIVLLEHEDGSVTRVAKTFTDMLNAFYDEDDYDDLGFSD